eukprot:4685022-Pyramimonas_sp.AAC.1
MEGRRFSKCASRRSAAHIRLRNLQLLQGWRAAPLQNGAPALSTRTFVFEACTSFNGSYS